MRLIIVELPKTIHLFGQSTAVASGIQIDLAHHLRPTITKLFTPLDPFVERDDYPLDDFYPPALAYWRLEDPENLGRLMGLPTSLGHILFIYNVDMYDAAGLLEPPNEWEDPGWTWDVVYNNARKLTITQGDETVQYGI